MRLSLPTLAVLAALASTTTISASDDRPPPVRERAVCPPPASSDCASFDYRQTACGIASRAVCAGLLVDLYAGAVPP
jgi:hypothetical protein